ncbi:MAG: 1-deoxy-D-xylulose-5-phosphate synthase [Proteobacteria bacterium]|nr:1-deoxy-D-xylulose-5-phosphate synthase [Pseudomonadota bacterium]
MGQLLDQIHTPDDVKALDRKDLPQLAEEIRNEIICVVAKCGGHLASNLGVIELTIALHRVFDPTRDRLIWDVGHQSYAHKILTGRREKFSSLRQLGGLSGFPNPQESPCDVFATGHAGTSISSALGVAEAKSLKGESAKVIAIIGDGSMTSGLAFEGLNQAGNLKRNLIVVLNDNEMSISPNVGALSSYLNRVMTGQFVNRFRNQIQSFLKTLPGIGESVYKWAKQAEESFKGFLTPGLLFEELGFNYVGPIEGHHLDHLIETFKNVREMGGPILVHVITKKGRGYQPAECDPARFHGVGTFEITSGKPIPKKKDAMTYTEVFGRTLCRLALRDDRIVAITAAMPSGTGLEGFSKKFPDRFYDIGIAEQHAVAFAAGLAVEGLRPVVAIYSTFLQRAYDQIIHDVCLQNLPVVFALDRGGIVGEDGPTHHGVFDFSYLRHIPNIVVMAPKDENELQHMMKTAVCSNSPIAFRYPRGAGYGMTLDPRLKRLEIGKAELLREGNDIVILGVGSTVVPSLEAAEKLEEQGIHAAVVNSRFVKPLDGELLRDLGEKIGRVLTVEENVCTGGFGTAVLEFYQAKRLPSVEVRCLGIPDLFLEHGARKQLREKYGIDSNGVYSSALEWIGKERSLRKTAVLIDRAQISH